MSGGRQVELMTSPTTHHRDQPGPNGWSLPPCHLSLNSQGPGVAPSSVPGGRALPMTWPEAVAGGARWPFAGGGGAVLAGPLSPVTNGSEMFWAAPQPDTKPAKPLWPVKIR